MGYREYEDLVAEFHVPMVVGGFEPLDLLEAISMLVSQLEEGRAEVENQYARSVNCEGNLAAQNILREVFEVSDRKWRGIGPIAKAVTSCARNMRTSMPNAFSRWRMCTPRSRRNASARWSCRG